MLEAVVATVKAVAQQEILPRYLKVARQRKADGSLFTEADVVTQEALSRELRKIFPGPVVGEEMTEQEQLDRWREGDAGLWCMDPIDGTSNFVNGLPYFAVSVALMRQGRSVLGVVYNPVADEMFYAEQGRGAYLNGEKLPIKEYVPPLRSAIANVDLKRLSRKLARRNLHRAAFFFPAQLRLLFARMVLHRRRPFRSLSSWRPEIVGLRRGQPDSGRSRRTHVRFRSG